MFQVNCGNVQNFFMGCLREGLKMKGDQGELGRNTYENREEMWQNQFHVNLLADLS